MSLLARAVRQAETEIGSATRRLVESVTEPVRAKGQVMAAEASAAVSRLVRIVVLKAAFGLVAAAMAIVALVYLVAALYQAILPHLGPVETRLVMAGVFLAVAAIAGLCMAYWPTGAPDPTTTRVTLDAKRVKAEAEAGAAEVAAAARAKVTEAKASLADAQAEPNAARMEQAAAAGVDSLRSGVESLAGVLGAAGFRREQAGLRAGLMLANQLKPMQLVSLALIGGFLAGMRRR